MENNDIMSSFKKGHSIIASYIIAEIADNYKWGLMLVLLSFRLLDGIKYCPIYGTALRKTHEQ